MNNTKKPSKKVIIWSVIGGLFLLSLPFTIPQIKPASTYISNFVQEKILQTKDGVGDSFATTANAPSASTSPDGSHTTSSSTGDDSSKIDYSYNPSAAPKSTNPDSKRTPTPAPDTPDVVLETQTSVNYLNSVRAEGGKAPLTENATMNAWALAHTREMVAAASPGSCPIFHTNNGQNLDPYLDKDIGPIVTAHVRENVGRAGSMQTVLVGLRNSPGHYANMMADNKYVGNGLIKVGTGPCKGNVYTTQIFAS